ncbi:site-specific integrase [Cupriavidus sp. WKF15]|uniref:site-specific integrase n=1 Tax=Cupriavidus sp. WKF15 TaxID=3032282 RepID=UPI0023E3111B|nr:site-specific integrase [Cupriavidus sp. WKF15]WER46572.1 site-specific integrase [Cupriavidus sp. WKF15]
MATLELIRYVPRRLQGDDKKLRSAVGEVVETLPQIVWADGTPWREANLWALERALGNGRIDIQTVRSNFAGLLWYARWLEESKCDWRHFPRRRADRCLDRFRGALIKARREGVLRPSTTSHYMASVIQFYRWILANALIDPAITMWKDKNIRITKVDQSGFERSISVQSSELAIPNRRVDRLLLEDGLLPVSSEERDRILMIARNFCSDEIFLMLSLGFYTGMRIGTICDLKISSLDRAVPDPYSQEIHLISVGPNADPPVHTKFGVNGQVRIPKVLLDEVRAYASNTHRLHREALARAENKDLVFLTKYGNRYARFGANSGNAINVEMNRLRQIGVKNGVSCLGDFNFHQSRCSFATALAEIAMNVGGEIIAISFIKEALLHANESTSLKYIRFLKENSIRVKMGNAFALQFTGIIRKRSHEK